MKHTLQRLQKSVPLGFQEAYDSMKELLLGDVPDSVMGAFLMGSGTQTFYGEELAGYAKAILEEAVGFSKESDFPLLFDNCGTGGDGLSTFNISTTTAFVVAAGGVSVAKHGNRSITSQSGSGDVLEALRIPLQLTEREHERQLRHHQFTFLFAPSIHPILKRVAKIRKEIGVPTVFNILGPLVNPMNITHQLVGVYDREKMIPMARALQLLGRKKALLVHHNTGGDEALLGGITHAVLLQDGIISELTLQSEDYGLKTGEFEDVIGGNAQLNAKILQDVLQNKRPTCVDTVIWNAALCYFTAEKVESIEEGISLARQQIESGIAAALLKRVQHSFETEGFRL